MSGVWTCRRPVSLRRPCHPLLAVLKTRGACGARLWHDHCLRRGRTLLHVVPAFFPPKYCGARARGSEAESAQIHFAPSRSLPWTFADRLTAGLGAGFWLKNGGPACGWAGDRVDRRGATVPDRLCVFISGLQVAFVFMGSGGNATQNFLVHCGRPFGTTSRCWQRPPYCY